MWLHFWRLLTVFLSTVCLGGASSCATMLKRPAGSVHGSTKTLAADLLAADAKWQVKTKHGKKKLPQEEKESFFRNANVHFEDVAALNAQLSRLKKKPSVVKKAKSELKRRRTEKKEEARKQLHGSNERVAIVVGGRSLEFNHCLLQEMVLLLGLLRQRDNGLLTGQYNVVSRMHQLQGNNVPLLHKLWKRVCLRWKLPSQTHSPQEATFHVLSQLVRQERETYAWIQRDLCPWIISEKVPLPVILYILLSVRYFHSVVFRDTLFEYLKSRWQKTAGTYATLNPEVFLSMYDAMVKRGVSLTSCFGPGRIVLIRSGQTSNSLRDDSVIHLKNLMSVAATMASVVVTEGCLFSAPAATVPGKWLNLFTSSFAPNVGEYYHKHTQGEFASIVEACKSYCLQEEMSFDQFTKQVWCAGAVYLEQVAHEMIAQVTVGPGPESLIVNYLVPGIKIDGDRQPQLRQVLEALRNWIIGHLKNPQTEVERFVSGVFGPQLAGMPDMFDFQCFLCMCKEGLIPTHQ